MITIECGLRFRVGYYRDRAMTTVHGKPVQLRTSAIDVGPLHIVWINDPLRALVIRIIDSELSELALLDRTPEELRALRRQARDKGIAAARTEIDAVTERARAAESEAHEWRRKYERLAGFRRFLRELKHEDLDPPTCACGSGRDE